MVSNESSRVVSLSVDDVSWQGRLERRGARTKFDFHGSQILLQLRYVFDGGLELFLECFLMVLLSSCLSSKECCSLMVHTGLLVS